MQGHSQRYNRDHKDAAGIVNVFIYCPDDDAEDFKEVERIQDFIKEQSPIRFHINGDRIVSV